MTWGRGVVTGVEDRWQTCVFPPEQEVTLRLFPGTKLQAASAEGLCTQKCAGPAPPHQRWSLSHSGRVPIAECRWAWLCRGHRHLFTTGCWQLQGTLGTPSAHSLQPLPLHSPLPCGDADTYTQRGILFLL